MKLTFVYKDGYKIDFIAHDLDHAKQTALSAGSFTRGDIVIEDYETGETITTARFIPDKKPNNGNFLMVYSNGYYKLWDDELIQEEFSLKIQKSLDKLITKYYKENPEIHSHTANLKTFVDTTPSSAVYELVFKDKEGEIILTVLTSLYEHGKSFHLYSEEAKMYVVFTKKRQDRKGSVLSADDVSELNITMVLNSPREWSVARMAGYKYGHLFQKMYNYQGDPYFKCIVSRSVES